MSSDYGLKKTINASGRMTILGVSTLSEAVLSGIAYGGKHYFEMAELYKRSGELVAAHCQSESAMITNSASAALTLAIAGLITKEDPYLVEHLHKEAPKLANEIILMKGHNVDYGAPIETMVYLGGGIVKEVGYANGCKPEHVIHAVNEKTAAVLFVQSHHCVQKNMPTLESIYKVCKEKNIPLIVDAAAEDGISTFSEVSDLVIFSGSKAIEGPSCGILAGKNEFVSYAVAHRSYIGRAMKVGKETVFGLLAALDEYGQKTMSLAEQHDVVKVFDALNQLEGVRVETTEDPAGRPIVRARVHVDSDLGKMSAVKLVELLKKGDIPIYTRDYHANEGHIDLDPRPLLDGDADFIVKRFNELWEGKR
ncbi:DgaE family pyridoxal phosphate-dependent ammonia lyase [Shouchella patagoniensis]|uniref:DgaE family pyridoxal phosphate-dependent ammonia lyase n=1 Tax=Shouchella patagoniensis TaxID=228576 RepID=UPI0009953AD7|nr:DgaE family pyridoxal phosphate-dependent ammonia lyase [Shouchella patagoniensis]